MFAFKYLLKKGGGGGTCFLGVIDRLIPGELKGLKDSWCFDGHESIVRVSEN
jgi:hypothetical protein